jgi:hypothetical protein
MTLINIAVYWLAWNVAARVTAFNNIGNCVLSKYCNIK